MEVISKDQFITENFFFTGGTALAEFYFQHRFSEDLDFFSEYEFDTKRLLASISTISKKVKSEKLEQQSLTGQEVFFFYMGKEVVKVDFAYFPFSHLGVFKKHGNLNISSMEDICINKMHAITTRNRARDYLDLYLCLQKLGWNVLDLEKNYKLKFDVNLPFEQMATSFVNVLDAKDLPKFLEGIPWSKVKEYFLMMAKGLKEEIIK